MTRNQLALAALAMFVFLPGCGIFANRPGLCNRCRNNSDRVNASPVSYPGPSGGDCGATVIPPGTTIQGAPIYTIPPGMINQPGEQLPPPQNIPKARIEEGKGKQYELDPASRPSGPVLTIPAVGSR